MNAPGLAATWRPVLGAPEFGSAIFGLRAFSEAIRSIVLKPAKRSVAGDDRNEVAPELAGLALVELKLIVIYYSDIIRTIYKLLMVERFARRQDLQTQELAKRMAQS
jgi:hypothetical protein